jgi:hypothetical protein
LSQPNRETVEHTEPRQNAATWPAITSPITMGWAVYLVSSTTNRTGHTVTYGTPMRQLLVSHRVVGLLVCGVIAPWILAVSLDDKSNGFQLEASWICSAAALERLCLVVALTTL